MSETTTGTCPVCNETVTVERGNDYHPCPNCQTLLKQIVYFDFAQADDPIWNDYVCSRCGASANENTHDWCLGEWRWNGSYWEHKCPDVHAQCGHWRATHKDDYARWKAWKEEQEA